ncbi:MAG: 30S ribosomal protein S9 [Candidatus Micrarchaeota archaeon]|nr:30S ribosomal protein S9 [Candidatus Micrarchaeota archaeon]
MANEAKGTENLDKELSSLYQEKAQVKREVKKTASKSKKKAVSKIKIVTAKGKRKRAIARATIRPGRGRIYINKIDVNFMKPAEIRALITEPITLTDLTDDIMSSSDISVNVSGGGSSGQAQAARAAIAKVLLKASSSEALRKAYIDYDRTMIADDYRRVEPKKFKGPKARARFQKSYR